MSENEELSESTDTQLLTAEYKDGQLQIVEVTPFHKAPEVSILPDVECDSGPKYLQVVNPDKSVMQLDLLNLTLVRCEDGSESYRLVSSAEAGDNSTEATVTCVLHSSDNEEVMFAEADDNETYMVMDGANPLVLYQPQEEAQEGQDSEVILESADTETIQVPQPKKLTPNEILERAKALQKSKQVQMAARAAQSHTNTIVINKRGRKRKSELPPPHELLASPNLKLFLYSCKMCSFKCNAIKEMTAHKRLNHVPGRDNTANKWRGLRRAPASALQCALCAYRGTSHAELMKHVQDIHSGRVTESKSNGGKVHLDTAEVEAADVLVCGACGYESASRVLFRKHIENVHGATAAC